MIQQLSILIPTRNDACLNQVEALQTMASKIDGLQYEIIVSDDNSTDPEAIKQNEIIATMENCKVLHRTENLGRAANRNFLARNARFDWLLFLDCNVKINNGKFLKNYLEQDKFDVVNGGIIAETDKQLAKHNLRYQYEKSVEQKHVASKRQKRPYKSFRTSNFMVRRDVMLANPLDETVSGYGYEDVLWGKTLCNNRLIINHIDNSVAITHFESNATYVAKVEEAMHTLHTLRHDLIGYSPLLAKVESLRKKHLISLYLMLYKPFAKCIRKNLIGDKPQIKLLNFYKLGYYLCIKD